MISKAQTCIKDEKFYPKVVIIILNWNGKEDTIECLESLKHITYPNYKILLVDNGSTDGSIECFKEKYPEIEIIENDMNLGFAEGNNVGIRKAMKDKADYVLLLNNDTVVDVKFLEELVKIAESDERIGIVGPKVYYYDYDKRKDIIWAAGGKINWYTISIYNRGMKQIESEQFDKVEDTDHIVGCAMLIKTIVLHHIGLLDTIYILFIEDTDLCVRALNDQWKIVYAPTSKIWHKVAKSTSKIDVPVIYFFTRNKIIFAKKFLKWRIFIALPLFLCWNLVYVGILSVKYRDYKIIKSSFIGILDGLKIIVFKGTNELIPNR